MSFSTLRVTDRLASGPSRGLGCAKVIVEEVLHSPGVLCELVAALKDKRLVVMMRAANALNKVQKRRPDLLMSHATDLVRSAAICEDLRTRWNLTAVIGELPLRGRNKALAIELMFEALGSNSGFLRTFALTGLANFAREDARLRRRVEPLVLSALEDDSGAVRARARKLAKALQKTAQY